MVINGAQETFTGRYSLHAVFTAVQILLRGQWAHEYTKLCTVSLHDDLYHTVIFSGEGASPLPRPFARCMIIP